VAETVDFVVLYRRAFEKYGTSALWNKRFFEDPSQEDGLWWLVLCGLKVIARQDFWRNKLSGLPG
jgi:hypothetical protein